MNAIVNHLTPVALMMVRGSGSLPQPRYAYGAAPMAGSFAGGFVLRGGGLVLGRVAFVVGGELVLGCAAFVVGGGLVVGSAAFVVGGGFVVLVVRGGVL